MNRNEKEVLQYQLDKEKAVLQALEKQYKRALSDILDKTKILQVDIDALDQAIETSDNDAQLLSMKRSKVYQQQYQQALKKQIEAILEKLHSDEYSTIQEYLNGCYADGFIGAAYSLQAQGIPIITPIDQKAIVQAVQLDSKVVEGYYKHLGVDFDRLKKVIPQEVSRGIASSLPYTDIARNLNNASKSGLYNAKRIVRTEGHRIQQQSAEDNRNAAKKKGADIVRQWDSTLDGRTRQSHRIVDGEIRELDEKFSNGLRFAGDPNGGAAEVINCRCVTLTRARWALDEEELETLKERAEYFGLDKTENFEDYKKKFLAANIRESDSLKNIGLQFFAISPDANSRKVAEFKKELKAGNVNLKIRREKQNEHIAGTKDRAIRIKREQENGTYSTFFYEGTDVEALIAGLFGTGVIEYDSESAMFPVEFISLANPVGKAYNYGTKKYVDVSRIAIQYGKKGVHAYPVKDW